MRYTEGALKPFGYLKMDPLNYICHSWLSENEIIVGTSACTLLILESGDVKEEIKLMTGKLELFFSVVLDSSPYHVFFSCSFLFGFFNLIVFIGNYCFSFVDCKNHFTG